MANWLLDYIEMTEYIPSELREQLTSIRELDLEVHNAMDELEIDIKRFFSQCNNLSQEERESKYQDFLNKCDVASKAANEKINVANKLHDLIEKSMRLLDQALEKLREDLLEGDKAYIVEDIEKKSHLLDEQIRLEQETLLQRQTKSVELKTSTYNHSSNINNSIPKTPKNHTNCKDDCIKQHTTNNNNNVVSHNSSHRHSYPAQHPENNYNNNNNNNKIKMTKSNINNNHQIHHRSRNNSTGGIQVKAGRQKKRERRRLNSTMTIFNRNSRSEDESTNQTPFPTTPIAQSYLTGCHFNGSNLNDKSINNVILDDRELMTTPKEIISSANNNIIINDIRNITAINNDKSNVNESIIIGAKQPILTAIDAAHAVSPNATNSDKIVMYSNNSNNGDKYNNTAKITRPHTEKQNNISGPFKTPNNLKYNTIAYQQQHEKLANHLIVSGTIKAVTSTPSTGTSTQMSIPTSFMINTKPVSGLGTPTKCNTESEDRNIVIGKNNHQHLNRNQTQANQTILSLNRTSSPFATTLPQLSSRNDPIMIAASQAINATQNMTPGRRTSSLKASYAAVNSGRLPTAPNQSIFEQTTTNAISTEVYCKCRSHIQGSDMIACDNNSCKIEWFHYECVGITTPPDGEWYCDDCKLTKNKRPVLTGDIPRITNHQD